MEKKFCINWFSKQIPVVILISEATEQLVSLIEEDYQDYLIKETLTKELIFSALRNAIALGLGKTQK